MIDLSKYEKVYEWESVYGLKMGKQIMGSTVVYLMKIGNDCYIDDTFKLNALIRKHIRDLDNGIHPNKKMQEAYNKHEVVDVYILAQVGLFEHPEKIKQQFIDRFSPSLNMDEFKLKYSKDFWFTDEDDSVEVKVKIPYIFIKKLNELSNIQDIPLEKYIQASALAIFSSYCYRNVNSLTPEGIAVLDNCLCNSRM